MNPRSALLAAPAITAALLLFVALERSSGQQIAPTGPRLPPPPAASAPAASRPLEAIRVTGATDHSLPLNDLVLAAVYAMPRGGQYTTDHRAFLALNQAITAAPDGGLQVRPELARPVFCSGATYLVLLKVLDQLNREGRLPMSPQAVAALQVTMQPDGVGVWGRWNANGPGTARLFREAQLGENFSGFNEGKPGDFMKIWWNDHIGAREHGHSVVYLGTSRAPSGEEMVNFWSGNVPDGLGFKSVPRTRVKRALFSRLENPRALERVLTLPGRDKYLADLLKRDSSEPEMAAMVGTPPAPDAARAGR